MVVSGPANGSTIPLSDCVAWKLTGTYNPNPDEQTVLLWRLLCDGQPVTKIFDAVVGSANEEIPANFTDKADCLLHTKVPDCDNPTQVINADEAVKEFTLQTGEYTVTKEDCEDRIDPDDLESQLTDEVTVTVLNSYINLWDEDQNADSGGIIMTARPRNYAICACACDWIYTYKRDLKTYRVCRYSTNSTQDFIATGGGASSPDVNGYPSGICQVSQITGIPISDIKWIELNFGSGDRYRTYKKRCKCSNECRFDLYFLEPLGGISIFCMECMDQINIDREGTIICLQEDCFGDAKENAQKYGQKYLSKNKWCRITGTVEKNVSENNILFFKALGASSHFYTRIPGTNILGGFLIADGSMPAFTKDQGTDITISGIVASGIKSHYTN